MNKHLILSKTPYRFLACVFFFSCFLIGTFDPYQIGLAIASKYKIFPWLMWLHSILVFLLFAFVVRDQMEKRYFYQPMGKSEIIGWLVLFVISTMIITIDLAFVAEAKERQVIIAGEVRNVVFYPYVSSANNRLNLFIPATIFSFWVIIKSALDKNEFNRANRIR